jgi:dTDP-4-dehydrorhamnose reductase
MLTGAGGQLGQELLRVCPADYLLRALSHGELDIADSSACERMVAEVKPDLIINAAAYTNVEKAEDDAETAMQVNASGPFNLANAARKASVKLLHISTDFVFDGKKRSPYKPDDSTAPLNSYGKSKLAGEQAILSVLGHQALIIRTSWLYGPAGKNFLTTILRLLRQKDELSVVNDQFGSPTSVISLAPAIFAAVKAGLTGVHHWCDGGVTSWHGFARAIQHQALEQRLLAKFVEISPIAARDYPGQAVRPAWSALDCSSMSQALRLKQIPWNESLVFTMKRLKA